MQDTVFRQNVTTNFILWIVSVLLIKHDPTVKRFIYAGFFFHFWLSFNKAGNCFRNVSYREKMQGNHF